MIDLRTDALSQPTDQMWAAMRAAEVGWAYLGEDASVNELEARGVPVPVRLLAATPFVLHFPHTYLNAVDPGRMLYGITFPGETPPVPLSACAAMSASE